MSVVQKKLELVYKGGPGSGPQPGGGSRAEGKEGGKKGDPTKGLKGVKGRVSHVPPNPKLGKPGRVSFSSFADKAKIGAHLRSSGLKVGRVHRFGGQNVIQYE